MASQAAAALRQEPAIITLNRASSTTAIASFAVIRAPVAGSKDIPRRHSPQLSAEGGDNASVLSVHLPQTLVALDGDALAAPSLELGDDLLDPGQGEGAAPFDRQLEEPLEILEGLGQLLQG
ncbi:MAG: hypothetical protein KC933_41135 [Myxococcales bacterium]|nr:hypothetical protein [Myxococcales bacterium]